MDPRALSLELRTGWNPTLRRRRGIFALSLAGAAPMALIGLYQVGILRGLPDLPGRLFDAEEVDGSGEAYAVLETPDAALGLVSYAVTAALAAAGSNDRARRRPWLPLVLLGKLTADALAAAKLTADQWRKHRAFCIWCLMAAGASFAALPLGVREAKSALAHLARRTEAQTGSKKRSFFSAIERSRAGGA